MAHPAKEANGNRRKSSAKPARAKFAALLEKHLHKGTRPGKLEGDPWTYVEFAQKISKGRSKSAITQIKDRTVSYWCNGHSVPSYIDPILDALFGPKGDPRAAAARAELRKAFLAAHAEKLKSAKTDRAGPHWKGEGNEIVIDRGAPKTDLQAAKDPHQRGLQNETAKLAAELGEAARRLANMPTWRGISVVAFELQKTLTCDPKEMVAKLSKAYALMLRLGGFIETDNDARKSPKLTEDGTLALDIRAKLLTLLRLGAPYLRAHPSVREWDDQAGKFLLRPELLGPAREFIGNARAQELIPEDDAAEMGMLADAAASPGTPGRKAAQRTIAGAKNLLLEQSQTLAASATPNSPIPELRAKRARAALKISALQAKELAEGAQPDMQAAMGAMIEESAADPPAPDPVPEDVEKQARAMILEGRAPPAHWRPFIVKLVLQRTRLSDLTPLANLTALQDLRLAGTRVSDLAPLANLAALQDLRLMGTRVSDLAPLANLTALGFLDLDRTQISDLAPLANLTALRYLFLQRTQVSDLAPLTNLTALQFLFITGTQVLDLAPLANLTALRSLLITGTQVSDLASLANLTALQSLFITGTQVSDLAPLANLTALRELHLSGTQISDLAPLANLTALEDLDLRGTQVLDLSPVRHVKRIIAPSGEIIRSPR